jgi:naphthalene 1,2-dioxygenase system ferredoxin subunit
MSAVDQSGWQDVGAADALAEGDMLAAAVADRLVAVYRVAGRLHATDNVCTHGQAMLTDGWLEDGVIECSLHGGRFDVCTGKGLGPPIEQDLATFAVREQQGRIQVRVTREGQ